MSETAEATTTITEHEAEQVSRANESGLAPVVFIHGLWLLPSSWDRWATVFEEAGFTALTPGWPDDPETVEEANAHPEVFAGKTVGQVADHYDEVIRRLDRKPAVIGHSFGGLLAQIIAGRGLAAVSVAIDPAPFRGVLPLPISALKSAQPVLGNPANRNRAVPLTLKQFRFGWANALSEDEAKELYETYSVPAPGAPIFQAASANLNPWTEAKVDSQEPRARAAADHLRREGPHRPVGDRQRVVQEAEAQRGRDRDRRDPEPRARAHDRQRLARGRRQGARVRQAVLVAMADPDQAVEDSIEQLIAREHELRSHAEGRGLSEEEQAEQRALEVRLDQLWDLLRRRRALRAAGEDPSQADVRPEDVVEHYEQ